MIIIFFWHVICFKSSSLLSCFYVVFIYISWIFKTMNYFTILKHGSSINLTPTPMVVCFDYRCVCFFCFLFCLQYFIHMSYYVYLSVCRFICFIFLQLETLNIKKNMVGGARGIINKYVSILFVQCYVQLQNKTFYFPTTSCSLLEKLNLIFLEMEAKLERRKISPCGSNYQKEKINIKFQFPRPSKNICRFRLFSSDNILQICFSLLLIIKFFIR